VRRANARPERARGPDAAVVRRARRLGGFIVSIVRVGLAETKKFSEGYEAIFGKKTSADEEKSKQAKAEKKPAKQGKKKKKK
jgi:hypothetical protein